MPDYAYAILSAMCWAASVPVLNIGLAAVRKEKALNILWPLLYSLSSGFIFCLLFGLSDIVATTGLSAGQLMLICLAGLLTYPLATGAYYLAGQHFGDRIEVASQFSKAKPGLTLLLAFLVLPDYLVGGASLLSIAALVIGIVLFFTSALKKQVQVSGILLGLTTALCWALGEVAMTVGMDGDVSGFAANTLALGTGLVLFIPVVSGLTVSGKIDFINPLRVWPFLIHGLLSFCLAYSLFFSSIKAIGVSATVLINAFWPLLSLLLVTAIGAMRHKPVTTPGLIWLGSIAFLLATVLQIPAITE